MAERFSCTGERISPYPLVLLHGWGFDNRIWFDIMPSLQQSFDVISLGLPCFGSTTVCSSNIDEVAQSLLEQLPGKSIFLGWSLGGLIATHIAIYFPQRVQALITVGSNLKWIAVDEAHEKWPGALPENFASFYENLAQNFEGSKQHFCGVIAHGDSKEKTLTKQLREKLSSAPQVNFLNGLDLLASIDNRQGFSSLTVPGLHVFGEKDAMVPFVVEQSLHQLNKKQQTKVFPNTAHVPFLSEPELFVTTLNDFIKLIAYQLDKKRIAESFSKAAPSYDKAAGLQREIGDRLFSLLPKNSAKTVLDIGSGTGAYSNQLQMQFPQAQLVSLDLALGMLKLAQTKSKSFTGICADAENLPFKTHSADIVFSNLAIQWCQNPDQLFAELYRALNVDGQCVISTFQHGTLKELKSAWQSVDEAIHVNHFAYAESLRESAAKAGFCSIDVQRQSLVRYYATVKELAAELKAVGAHNINADRSSGLTGKRTLAKMVEAYERFRDHDQLPAHYEVVYLLLKKVR